MLQRRRREKALDKGPDQQTAGVFPGFPGDSYASFRDNPGGFVVNVLGIHVLRADIPGTFPTNPLGCFPTVSPGNYFFALFSEMLQGCAW